MYATLAFIIRLEISSVTPPPALTQLPRYTNLSTTSNGSPARVSAGTGSCQSCNSTLHLDGAKHIPYLQTLMAN
uniref:Uncharacterized protein n=1 Tax=Trichobilharzia regenti TaxID=157069 RepID=A0AA85JLX5_TRIRE|nr:unnamed protein product [Trichobilharzia regenti]